MIREVEGPLGAVTHEVGQEGMIFEMESVQLFALCLHGLEPHDPGDVSLEEGLVREAFNPEPHRADIDHVDGGAGIAKHIDKAEHSTPLAEWVGSVAMKKNIAAWIPLNIA